MKNTTKIAARLMSRYIYIYMWSDISMEVLLTARLGNYNRPADLSTDRQTDGLIPEVPFTIIENKTTIAPTPPPTTMTNLDAAAVPLQSQYARARRRTSAHCSRPHQWCWRRPRPPSTGRPCPADRGWRPAWGRSGHADWHAGSRPPGWTAAGQLKKGINRRVCIQINR